MATRSTRRTASSRKKTSRSRRRFRLPKIWPTAATRKRWLRRFLHLPPVLQFSVVAALLIGLWLVLNWTYQVARKPSELFFPVSDVLYRTPAETWDAYGS